MITKIIMPPRKNKIETGDAFALKAEQGVFAALREQGLISQAQFEECMAICARKHKKSGERFEW